MKISIIIYSNDSETVWNVFRLANLALQQKDDVKVFLLAKGVEAESLDTEKFKIRELMQTFLEKGGAILACTTCIKLRQQEASELCPLSTMQDLYDLIKNSDRVLTF
ncbi:MAG: DsrE family protein [Deltaproteobacteria bacterium]|nr:DsrE family protein [Deltaproteobacteria bacterium]